KRLLNLMEDREQFLWQAASQERAGSVKGALFQIAAAASYVDQVINSSAWREFFELDENIAWNPPKEVERLQTDIYRLLWSSAKIIAQLHGIPEKEYAGDYFMSIDPFKEIEA